MTVVPARAPAPAGYSRRLTNLARAGVMQVVRPPSHSRRAQAVRGWAHLTLMLLAVMAVAILALMIWVDANEIAWMPPRGTASLWPMRIVTDFGKANYVIAAVCGAMIALLLIAPRATGVAHATLIGLASRLQYVFLSVLVSYLAGEILKVMIGRGRPFVGGEANAFNFSSFSWNEAYASFPSGHATASCALALAVAAVWPRLRIAMAIYAAAILISRLVLLAHHPSDVVAGALVGTTGAMLVRYWFAARNVVFRIGADGSIVARDGASAAAIMRALRAAIRV